MSERGRNSTMALPARPVSSWATITSALGDFKNRCRLRRESRSVAKTRCSSAASASTSPRSALRTHTSGTGAWASVEDIVTSKGSTLIPASIPASPRPRIVAAGGWRRSPHRGAELPADSAISAFEPVCRPPRPTDERRNRAARETRPKALSLRQKPYRFNRERYRFNEGPLPSQKSCDRRVRPHPPPRRSKRPARMFHPGGLAL